MKKMGIINVLSIATLVVTIPTCVTINIYFPAAAAEKAADKIIDDVWQLKPGETTPEKINPSETNPIKTNPSETAPVK